MFALFSANGHAADFTVNNNGDIGAYEFGVAQPPTAASVIVSGRVLSSDGSISNAYITLTNQRGETRTTVSNPFGYYHFEEIPIGEVYVFEVRHKSYQFASQIVTVTEEMNDLNFTAGQ